MGAHHRRGGRSTRARPTAAGSQRLADTSVLEPVPAGELLDLDPGDPSMLLRFIDRFGPNARATLAGMREAREAGTPTSSAGYAHALKGSASNLGATRLAEPLQGGRGPRATTGSSSSSRPWSASNGPSTPR